MASLIKFPYLRSDTTLTSHLTLNVEGAYRCESVSNNIRVYYNIIGSSAGEILCVDIDFKHDATSADAESLEALIKAGAQKPGSCELFVLPSDSTDDGELEAATPFAMSSQAEPS
jgi:hypothetical protein